MAENLDKLYEKYNILLDAKEKITEHEQDYFDILTYVKGTPKEKRLASSILTKFFKHFPSKCDAALDAILDLCEDEDINIRKQAIKDLPLICKDCKDYVPRITDILAQLLVADDANELQVVNSSLMTVCDINPKGFLEGIFTQVYAGEDLPRNRVINFLSTKIKTLSEQWTKEVEECFMQKCRKALSDCTKDDFVSFMQMLSSLKITKTISGQQSIVEMITEQAELDVKFNPNDAETIDKFLMCVRSALPHFSPFVPSNLYVQYFSTEIMPVLDQVATTMAEEVPGIDLEILQCLAELAPFVQQTNTNFPINIEECQKLIFNKLVELMPMPPAVDVDGTQNNAENEPEPSLQLTHVECLMFILHTFGKAGNDFLSTIEENKIKEFKLQLQYLARCLQTYIRKLKESIASLEKEKKTQDEENKLKITALRTTTNIKSIILDFFHPKPTYKTPVTLSWKPTSKQSASFIAAKTLKTSTAVAAAAAVTTAMDAEAEKKATNPENANKRKPITAPEVDEKKPKKDGHQIYTPPSGKYSGGNNFRKNFNGPNQGFRGRGRGRGRGGSGPRFRYNRI